MDPSSSNARLAMFCERSACCGIITPPMALESRIQTDWVYHLLTIVIRFFEVRIATPGNLCSLKCNNWISSPQRCSRVIPDKRRSPIDKNYLVLLLVVPIRSSCCNLLREDRSEPAQVGFEIDACRKTEVQGADQSGSFRL